MVNHPHRSKTRGMSYATDGKCHNVQPGTYGHECGKPAEFIGTTWNGFRSGFCRKCRESGYEAREVVKWERLTVFGPINAR